MVYCYDCKFFSRGEAEERGRVSEYFVCDATHRALWKRFLSYDLDCRFYEAAESVSEICRDCISLCDKALDLIAEAKKEEADGSELPQEYISGAYRDWEKVDDYSLLRELKGDQQ